MGEYCHDATKKDLYTDAILLNISYQLPID